MQKQGVDKEKREEFLVCAYLKKKGYQHSIQMFKQESKGTTGDTSIATEQLAFESNIYIDTCMANYFTTFSGGLDQSRYGESYSHLRDWTQTSLDLYKVKH